MSVLNFHHYYDKKGGVVLDLFNNYLVMSYPKSVEDTKAATSLSVVTKTLLCIEIWLNIKGELLTAEQHCLRPVCFFVWHHSQQANNNYRQFLHFIDKLSSLKTPTSHFLLSRLTAVFQILNLNYVQVCLFFFLTLFSASLSSASHSKQK